MRDDIRLDCEAVANVRDIANVNGRVVHLFDRQIVQRLQKFRAGIQPHVVFAVADFFRPGREDHVLSIECAAHVCGRKPFTEKFLRIQIDHDLAGFATVWQRHLCALDGSKLRADEIQTEIVQVLFGKRFTR